MSSFSTTPPAAQTVSLFIRGTNNTNALGLAFLPNVYVVYDFSHNQVSLARTNFESTIDNFTAIGPNGVDALTSTTPSNAIASQNSSSSSATHSNSELSVGAKAGIGVGVRLGALLLGTLMFHLLRGHLRRTRPASPDTSHPPASQTVSALSQKDAPLSADGEGHGNRHRWHNDGHPGPQELDSNP